LTVNWKVTFQKRKKKNLFVLFI